MEMNPFANISKRSRRSRRKPSAPVENELPVGIVREKDGFLCLICSRELTTLQGSVSHSNGQQHIEALLALRNCHNADRRIAKIFSGFSVANWKSLFRDLENNQTITEDKNLHGNISYVTLQMNQIIEHYEGSYFCCCCGKILRNGWLTVVNHVKEKKHKELQKTHEINDCDKQNTENQSRMFVKNHVSHCSYSYYYCYLCDRLISGQKNGICHIKGLDHTENIAKRGDISYLPLSAKVKTVEKTVQKITKPAQDAVAKSLSNNKVMQNLHGCYISYVTLQMNQIIELHQGSYFCCCCGKILRNGWLTVVDHVKEKKHKELQKAHEINDCDKQYEDQSRMFVKNYVSHCLYSNYYCYLCDRLISGQKNCLLHIKGYDHTTNIAKRGDISYLPLSAKVKTVEKTVRNITKPMQDAVAKPLSKVMQENSVIGPSKNGTYYCKLCGCTCIAIPHVTQHISGKQHKYRMEQACKDTTSGTESKETESSSSSSKLTKYSSDSWETNEVSGSYELSQNPSDSWETFDTRPSASWETISTQSSVSEPRGPKLLEIPENLMPLISKHLLQHREKEVYCPACEAHIKDPKNIVNHIVSRQHIAELSTYRARVAQKPQNRADTLENKISPNSVSRLTSEKKSPASINVKNGACTPAQKTTTTWSETPERKMLYIPAHLSPLFESNSLTQSDGEVFCQACGVRSKHLNNVFEHINGRNHKAMLKVYRSKHADKCKSTAKTLKINSAVYTPTHTANKKNSLTNSQDNVTASTSSTNTPQIPSSSLMDIPEKLVPLIAIHSLRHFKNEIYCPACDVRIYNATSLVNHTKGRRHTERLELLKITTASKNVKTQEAPHLDVAEACETLDPKRGTHGNKMEPNRRSILRASDDIIALEKSVNNLTIAEVKGKNPPGRKGNETQKQDVMKTSRKLQRIQNFKNGQLKQKKPQTPNNKRINGRRFDPKYLKVEMQYIYEVNPEKMRMMKLSCQLCFPTSSTEIYCLICEKSVASELQKFYEHICSIAHTRCLAMAEEDNKYFISYPEQFSALSLAKEFLQETEEENIQCLACDEIIDNDDVLISEHIEEDSHKEEKQAWNLDMNKILRDILAKNESTWYNIQKYWCQPCDMQCNTEFHFAEHMDTKKHNKSLQKIGAFRNRLVYDACIPCATLWLSLSDLYAQHCDQPMHKYLVQTGDYSVCALPRQVKSLLENSEVEVEKLIKLSDQVSTVQKIKADTLLKCLEDTVKPKFPYAKAHPFGSRVSGLGFPDSDIDVFLDCGTYSGAKYTKDFEMEIIMSVEACLYANQQSWEIEETLISSRTPIIKLRHRSTELRCDVSFKNGLSVENTKLLKCFMDNYPLSRKLMLFLKKWLNDCNLSGSQYITNYAICWYVIFYLQSKPILPSVASMIAKENKSKIIDGWETGICETFDECLEEFTFTELLYGFFVFYTNFDYRYSVACPLLGSTVPKQDFTELHLLPKEMAPYVNHIKTKNCNGPVELFRIDSEMCIQDPYDLSHNLTKAVKKFTLNRFKRLCAASADVLNNLNRH